jgi:gluconokinase
VKKADQGTSFKAIIVMGVSGCGKTTIASLLAERLGWIFIESDNYHSKDQVRKMTDGIPLTDKDRQPWLEELHTFLVDFREKDKPVVMACSALKESYRQLLTKGQENILFVFLKGKYDLILQRMQQREHFMKAGMLKSQFDTLEEPANALTIDINEPPDQIIRQILAKLDLSP